MIIVCEHCKKKGLVDDHPYLGYRLRSKCPYCKQIFVYKVALNGDDLTSAVVDEGTEPEVSPGQEILSPPADVLASNGASEEVISEAKRIARLIVSEIKLYNQDKISRANSKKEI